jgi:hypothetical protein
LFELQPGVDAAGISEHQNSSIFLAKGVDLKQIPSIHRENPFAAISHLNQQRIRFLGGLHCHIINFDILEEITANVPDAFQLLSRDATSSVEHFIRFPIIVLLVMQSHKKSPGHRSVCDVEFVPWLDQNWTHNLKSLSWKEYLALTPPVFIIDFAITHIHVRSAITRKIDNVIAAIRRLLFSTPKPRTQRIDVLTRSWAHSAILRIALYEDRVQWADVENN